MLRKIVIGSLVVALIAVLVIGAMNRTNVRIGEEANHNGGRWAQTDSGEQRGQGFGARNRGQNDNAARSNTAQGQVQVSQWLTLEGKAVSVAADRLVVALEDGKTVEVSGRAWSFAQQQGFRVQAGEAITVIGFYEDGATFVAGKLINKVSGQSVAIRDGNGLPLWSGRGRNRT